MAIHSCTAIYSRAARDTQVALALLAGMVNGGYLRRARAGDADELPSKAILTEL